MNTLTSRLIRSLACAAGVSFSLVACRHHQTITESNAKQVEISGVDSGPVHVKSDDIRVTGVPDTIALKLADSSAVTGKIEVSWPTEASVSVAPDAKISLVAPKEALVAELKIPVAASVQLVAPQNLSGTLALAEPATIKLEPPSQKLETNVTIKLDPLPKLQVDWGEPPQVVTPPRAPRDATAFDENWSDKFWFITRLMLVAAFVGAVARTAWDIRAKLHIHSGMHAGTEYGVLFAGNFAIGLLSASLVPGAIHWVYPSLMEAIPKESPRALELWSYCMLASGLGVTFIEPCVRLTIKRLRYIRRSPTDRLT